MVPAGRFRRDEFSGLSDGCKYRRHTNGRLFLVTKGLTSGELIGQTSGTTFSVLGMTKRRGARALDTTVRRRRLSTGYTHTHTHKHTHTYTRMYRGIIRARRDRVKTTRTTKTESPIVIVFRNI